MRRVMAGFAVVVLAVALTVGVAGAANRAKVRRPGPLRVLLVGDSITVNYQDEAAAALGAKGYQVIQAGIASSSLLDTGICDGQWARDLLAYVDPDVVVFENNGNYANRATVAPCKSLVYGSAKFFARWHAAASSNQRTLTRQGARFLWVQAPTVNFSPKREAVPQLNAIYRGLGPSVDAWTAFGGAVWHPEWHYDNQHLNQAGADKLAALVVAAVG